jgi:hypothetical protein
MGRDRYYQQQRNQQAVGQHQVPSQQLTNPGGPMGIDAPRDPGTRYTFTVAGIR